MGNIIFVDAETDGLYGSFITVGIIVTNENCEEINRFYYGIKKENLVIENEWVKEHVLPIMGDYEPVENEAELLEHVWDVWKTYGRGGYIIGDVIYPVESRLFTECVKQNLNERMMQGPFPFLDLSSLLYAKGYEPLADRNNLVNQDFGTQHNALTDVEIMIAVYKKIMGV